MHRWLADLGPGVSAQADAAWSQAETASAPGESGFAGSAKRLMLGAMQIEFLFDFLSPYAYLAWQGLIPIAERHDAELVPRPILLAALLNQWNTKGPAETPVKARFVFLDGARRAAQLGVEYRCPAMHPFNPLLACRLATTAAAGDDQRAVIDTLWKHGWQQGNDLGDPESLLAALNSAGLDGAALIARTATPEVKAELRANTDSAIEREVFGVPTMFLGDAMYWGNDQLDLVEHQLTGGTPVMIPDLLDRLPRGASAGR